MIEFERNRRHIREIGLLPIINIVFMLLIFFIVAGKIENVEVLPVEVPFAEKSTPVDEGKTIIVLGKHEEILANDEYLLTLDELRRWANENVPKLPNRVITVKADANAEAGRVLDVMKILEEAGGKRLALATQLP